MPNHVTTRCEVHGDAEQLAEFRRTMIVEMRDDHSGRPFTAFDFNGAIACPDSVRATSGAESSNGEIAAKMLFWLGNGGGGAPYDRDALSEHEWRHVAPGIAASEMGRPHSIMDRFFGDKPMTADVFREWLAANLDAEAAGKRRLRALAETGHQTWYGWNVANWGTKWNAYRFRPIADEPLTFQFETAWSFPAPIFEALAARYQGLRFYCRTFDEGWGFGGAGWFNGKDGEPAFTQGRDQATEALYEAVYGHPPERDEDEDDEDAAEAVSP